ncbi:MAG: hypothetical protein WBG71_07280 [Leeuwenhoekiella sp.]
MNLLFRMFCIIFIAVMSLTSCTPENYLETQGYHAESETAGDDNPPPDGDDDELEPNG